MLEWRRRRHYLFLFVAAVPTVSGGYRLQIRGSSASFEATHLSLLTNVSP
jgi:hypothetical protein